MLVCAKSTLLDQDFSSLSASCYLADAGFEVNLFEKMHLLVEHGKWLKKVLPLIWAQVGIGCLTFLINFFGFWKENFDFYELKRLSPAYRVIFEDGTSIDIPDSIDEIFKIFEKEEPGAGKF